MGWSSGAELLEVVLDTTMGYIDDQEDRQEVVNSLLSIKVQGIK